MAAQTTETEGTTRTTPLRLSYAAFADHLTGQIGPPRASEAVPLSDRVVAYLGEEDPADLVAFQVSRFSKALTRAERGRAEEVLGPEILRELEALRNELPPRRRGSLPKTEEDLRRQFEEELPRREVALSPPRVGLVEARLVAHRAWDEGVQRRPLLPVILKEAGEAARGAWRVLFPEEPALQPVRLGRLGRSEFMKREGLHGREIPYVLAEGNPMTVRICRQGDRLVASGSISEERSWGKPIRLYLWLKPSAAKALGASPERPYRARGKIGDNGQFEFTVGRLAPGARLGSELYDDYRIVI